MKKIFYIILILAGEFALAQTQVTFEGGLASVDGKPWLTVTKGQKNSYVVRNLLGYDIATLTFKDNNDRVTFKGEFGSFGVKYEVNYPAGTTIQTVLESYNKNKVIVDGKIDPAGLQNYCDARKIKLTRILSKEQQKEYSDSVKSKGKRFSFSIHAGPAYSFREYPEGMRTLVFYDPWGYHAGVSYQFKASTLKGTLKNNIGLDFEFRVSENIFLNYGLSYAKLVYQTKGSTLCYSSTWYDISPKVYYDTVSNFNMKEEYYFSSLPIGAFYRLNRKTHFYTFGGGASLNVLFRSYIHTNYGTGDVNPYNYKPQIAPPILFAKTGVFGNLGGGRALGLEMEFKYYSQYTFFTLGTNIVLKL